MVALKKAIYSGCETGEELIENFFANTEIPERTCKKLGVDVTECIKIYRYLVLQISAKVDDVLSKYPDADADNLVAHAIPPFMEMKIDGSSIGLSRYLSLDVFTPYSTIMDFKSGYERSGHVLSLAGYALALEADNEADVNFGFLIYIRVDKNVHLRQKGFAVSDELRREFLEIRDEIAEIVDSGLDPGKPIDCPKYCAYYNACNEDSC